MKASFSWIAVVLVSAVLCASNAMAATVTFSKLAGLTGAAAGPFTAVYVADLATTGLASIDKITLTDTSGGQGGSTGQFSGTDLDGIFISPNLVGNAALVGGLPITAAISYSPAWTNFVPGTQRPVADPSLFNVSPGGAINFAASTLGSMDAIGFVPGGGYFAMGDGGALTLNLTTAIDPSIHRYLYVGEVGDNGETFTASAVPEPSTLILAGLGGLAMVFGLRRRARG
jgi:hypothetical protein